MDSADLSIRQAFANALTRVGGLADRAAVLAEKHLDEPVGETMRGPDEDAALVMQVLDRLGAELALAKDQTRAVAAERDRLISSLAKIKHDGDQAERNHIANESALTLRNTELSRQLAEHKTNRVEATDRRTTPRERTRISELEAALEHERAARTAEKAELVVLLRDSKVAVERAKAGLRSSAP